jgi:hypothetical protein
MTKPVAWIDEQDKDFLAILVVALMDYPEYKFEVREETLCVVRSK